MERLAVEVPVPVEFRNLPNVYDDEDQFMTVFTGVISPCILFGTHRETNYCAF